MAERTVLVQELLLLIATLIPVQVPYESKSNTYLSILSNLRLYDKAARGLKRVVRVTWLCVNRCIYFPTSCFARKTCATALEPFDKF